jgi:dihydrofolate reductase
VRELTYYVAATLDGYIAGPAGEVDDFDASEPVIRFIAERYPETLPGPARDQLGVDCPNRKFDTVLMGRATYDVGALKGLMSPYPHLRQVVFSTTIATSPDSDVVVYDADPVSVVRDLKPQPGLGIWLCGGGTLAGALVDEIDVLVVKRQALILGGGRPMVDGRLSPHRFELVDRTDVGPVSVETHHRVRAID